MTREETIELKAAVGRLMYSDNKDIRDYNALIDFIESALRPVSREQLDVVINSLKLRLENNEENGVVSIPKFAVEQMIERLEVLRND